MDYEEKIKDPTSLLLSTYLSTLATQYHRNQCSEEMNKKKKPKKRTMLSAFVITIIITPTVTCCAALLIYPAQHLFITVIVTLGS